MSLRSVFTITLTVVLVAAPRVGMAQEADPAGAGVRSGRSDARHLLWTVAGCLFAFIGAGQSMLVAPSPVAGRLLGRSSDYADDYIRSLGRSTSFDDDGWDSGCFGGAEGCAWSWLVVGVGVVVVLCIVYAIISAQRAYEDCLQSCSEPF